MLWLAFAGLVIALIVMGHGLRPDLTLRLHQPTFAITTAAAPLATGILSAIAAFRDQPSGSLAVVAFCFQCRRLRFGFPSIGYGCLNDWVSIGPEGVRFGEELRCFSILVAYPAVPLTIALAVMLRYARDAARRRRRPRPEVSP